MGIIKRQSIKGIVVQYAGVFLGIITSVFIMPYCLSKEELGLTRIFTTLMIIFSQASLLGTIHRVIKFSPFYEEKAAAASFNKHNLKLTLIGCSIIALLLVIFKDQIISYFIHDEVIIRRYFFLLIPLTLVQSLITLFDIFANTKMRLAVPVLLKEVVQKILLIIVILLYYFHFTSRDGYFLSFLFTYVAICIGFGIYLYVLKVPFRSKDRFDISGAFGKEQRVFMYTSYLFTLLATLQANIDSLIVPGILDIKTLGVYSTILFFANMIQVPYRSISAITIPVIALAWKENDIDHIKKLYSRSSVNLLLIAAFIFILGWGNIHSLLALFPPGFITESLHDKAAWLFFILGMAKILDSGLGLNSEILEKSPYYKANVMIVIINIILSFFLYTFLTPRYGLIGIALSLCINLFLCNLMRIAFIYAKWKISPFSTDYFRSLILIIAFLTGVYFIPDLPNVFISIIVKSAAIAVLFIFLVFRLRLSEDVNDLYTKLISGALFQKRKEESIHDQR